MQRRSQHHHHHHYYDERRTIITRGKSMGLKWISKKYDVKNQNDYTYFLVVTQPIPVKLPGRIFLN